MEALPGVGRKTANVVLNVAFGEPTMAVDTHIFRMGNRTGLAPGKTPYEVEMGLLKRIPAAYLVDAHHWLCRVQGGVLTPILGKANCSTPVMSWPTHLPFLNQFLKLRVWCNSL